VNVSPPNRLEFAVEYDYHVTTNFIDNRRTAHTVHTTGWKAAPLLVNRADPSWGPRKIDAKGDSYMHGVRCSLARSKLMAQATAYA